MMKDESYIEDRLEQQINWYDVKSINAQKRFKQLKGFEIVAAASIPLIAGFGESYIAVNITVSVLGFLIAITAAFIALNQYQELWIKYRMACEALRHEKYLYLTGSSPYQTEDPLSLLVQRVENIIAGENAGWSQTIGNIDVGDNS